MTVNVLKFLQNKNILDPHEAIGDLQKNNPYVHYKCKMFHMFIFKNLTEKRFNIYFKKADSVFTASWTICHFDVDCFKMLRFKYL